MRLQQSKDVLHLGWAWISGRLGTCTPPVTSEDKKMIGGDRVVTLTFFLCHAWKCVISSPERHADWRRGRTLQLSALKKEGSK